MVGSCGWVWENQSGVWLFSMCMCGVERKKKETWTGTDFRYAKGNEQIKGEWSTCEHWGSSRRPRPWGYEKHRQRQRCCRGQCRRQSWSLRRWRPWLQSGQWRQRQTGKVLRWRCSGQGWPWRRMCGSWTSLWGKWMRVEWTGVEWRIGWLELRCLFKKNCLLLFGNVKKKGNDKAGHAFLYWAKKKKDE